MDNFQVGVCVLVVLAPTSCGRWLEQKARGWFEKAVGEQRLTFRKFFVNFLKVTRVDMCLGLFIIPFGVLWPP